MVVINEFFGDYVSIFIFNKELALSVLTLSAVLAIASLFIFKFYNSISRRNLIKLNLKKYNTSDHPLFSKVFAILLYLLEYIVIMPFLIMLWFAGLAIVLLLIAQQRLIGEVLWITASMIGAIRILAYVRSEIAKDLAKLFPFITLSVFVLSWDTVDLSGIFDKVKEIPALLTQVLAFIFVVFIVEIVLRILFEVYDFWSSEGGRDEAIEEMTKKMRQDEIKKAIEEG